MKLIFAYILLPVLSYGQAVDTVDINDLEDRFGVFYKSDKLFTGVGLDYYESGQKKSEGNFKDGKREGLWTVWQDNAYGEKRSEGNYKDGQKEGLWTEWDDNVYGQKSEGNYKDGEREGLWTVWEMEGNLKEEGLWTGNYKNGKEEGLWTRWHFNGPKISEGNYKDGSREGLWTFWYENGQKESEDTYDNGFVASSNYFPFIDEEEESRETNNKLETAFWTVFIVICFGLPILLLRWLLLRKNKSCFTDLFIVIVAIFLLIELFVFLIAYGLTGWRPNG